MSTQLVLHNEDIQDNALQLTTSTPIRTAACNQGSPLSCPQLLPHQYPLLATSTTPLWPRSLVTVDALAPFPTIEHRPVYCFVHPCTTSYYTRHSRTGASRSLPLPHTTSFINSRVTPRAVRLRCTMPPARPHRLKCPRSVLESLGSQTKLTPRFRCFTVVPKPSSAHRISSRVTAPSLSLRSVLGFCSLRSPRRCRVAPPLASTACMHANANDTAFVSSLAQTTWLKIHTNERTRQASTLLSINRSPRH